MKRDLIKLGEVSVDSGQIIICDPCYIDSMWKNEEFVDQRRYRQRGTEVILEFRKDFQMFNEVIPAYGKDMNTLIDEGEFYQLPYAPAKHPFSYNGCCVQTLSGHGGELAGGSGVASSSGWGDGSYPVVAEIREGRVKSITITFF